MSNVCREFISRIVPLRTRIGIRGKLRRLGLMFKVVTLFRSGLNKHPRDKRIIVSLTSFPERVPYLHFTLCSLLTQTFQPDEIILWLGCEQFPCKEYDIPKQVLSLQQLGITIKWCKDIKSYKKLVPSLSEYANDIIVTADDDTYYQKNWLSLLYKGYLDNPTCISCHLANKITFDKFNSLTPYITWPSSSHEVEASFLNFITGSGGVLYPPNLLHSDVLNEELFLKLSPLGDDIWFWAMAVLNNTKIYVVKDNIPNIQDVCPERNMWLNDEFTLFRINGGENFNDKQFKNIFHHYAQLKKNLISSVS